MDGKDHPGAQKGTGMKLGICDDNPQDRLALRQILYELRQEDEVECFSDGTALLQALQGGVFYSCLFLDVLIQWIVPVLQVPLYQNLIF